VLKVGGGRLRSGGMHIDKRGFAHKENQTEQKERKNETGEP